MNVAAKLLALLTVALALTGCLERRVSITSEPEGAVVYANDVELGRTPLEAAFTYYGAYDVRVEKEGFEPLRTEAKARAPLYEYPPLDLVATAAPVSITTVVRWHFKLEPELSTTMTQDELERTVIERAHGLRMRIEGAE
jgi:hypothetical protein